MARSDPQLELFVDRSLGKSIVEGLLDVGLTARSMADVYGERRAQVLPDRVWLADAGRHDWVVLTKDDRIRRRPAELDAMTAAGVRVFCLTSAGLRGEEQAARFVNNRFRIIQRARKPGPYIYGVYENALRRLWPPT